MQNDDASLAGRIEAFLGGSPFAVVGASADRSKFGNRVLRALVRAGREVHPVNPRADAVEGLPAWPSLTALVEGLGRPPHAVSIVTPPAVTEQVVREAAGLGIRHAWMQPGAESDEAVRIGRAAGMQVIAGDACLLVVLGVGGQ